MSLQGEGKNTGKQVVFIRLSGCNLKCAWCDTQHKPHTIMSCEQILAAIARYNCKSIILTGGEPCIHDLTSLINLLKQNNYWIGIETNGTKNVPLVDYIAVSPKANTFIQCTAANEVRVVVDINYSIEQLFFYTERIQAIDYYLTPLEQGGVFNYKETIKLLGEVNNHWQKHKVWKLSMQMHKLAGIK